MKTRDHICRIAFLFGLRELPTSPFVALSIAILGEGCGQSTVTPASKSELASEQLEQRPVGQNDRLETVPKDKSGVVLISGLVLAETDISTQPPQPFRSGMVLAVSVSMLPKLDERTREQPGGTTKWPRPLALTAEMHKEFASASAWLRPDAGYSMNIYPGRYCFGLANLGQSHPDPKAYPLMLYAWSEATVESSSRQTLNFIYNQETGKVKVQGGKAPNHNNEEGK